MPNFEILKKKLRKYFWISVFIRISTEGQCGLFWAENRQTDRQTGSEPTPPSNRERWLLSAHKHSLKYINNTETKTADISTCTHLDTSMWYFICNILFIIKCTIITPLHSDSRLIVCRPKTITLQRRSDHHCRNHSYLYFKVLLHFPRWLVL